MPLASFNKEILLAIGGTPFRHAMLIDGNDLRGIDFGLLTRKGFPIGKVRSHVDDVLPNDDNVFSRDCPEFEVSTPSGNTLFVLVNHFKSKGYGKPAKITPLAAPKPARQGDLRLADVAIVGDLNDTPDSTPLRPLIKNSDLKDVFTHPSFDDGGFKGTYGLCNPPDKIDYMLLSPKLFSRVSAGGVLREAMWPGSRPRRWDTFPELVKPQDAGSDHAAIWVDPEI